MVRGVTLPHRGFPPPRKFCPTPLLRVYNGDLQTIFFADEINPEIKKQICSVLAGYVWDATNPFIKKHKTILPTLAKVVRLKQSI
ncbi:MAG: hypothetical protein K0B10_06540 [Vicingaceae bacterium]|nr:hypothetical protein [Vicingaceae bacterium]